MWSANGREIFYLDSASNIVSVAVTAGDSFKAGIPKILFQPRLVDVIQRSRYEVTHDGQRFLLLTPQKASTPRP